MGGTERESRIRETGKVAPGKGEVSAEMRREREGGGVTEIKPTRKRDGGSIRVGGEAARETDSEAVKERSCHAEMPPA